MSTRGGTIMMREHRVGKWEWEERSMGWGEWLKRWRQWASGWHERPPWYCGPRWCLDLGCCQGPCLVLKHWHRWGALYWCLCLLLPLRAIKRLAVCVETWSHAGICGSHCHQNQTELSGLWCHRGPWYHPYPICVRGPYLCPWTYFSQGLYWYPWLLLPLKAKQIPRVSAATWGHVGAATGAM